MDFNRLQRALHNELKKCLLERGETIATMESCTGGQIGDKITNISGASGIHSGGIITHSTLMKNELGGVPNQTTDAENGPRVYSKEKAETRAYQASKEAGSAYGIGVTGELFEIAPNNKGGTSNEVYISIYSEKTGDHYTESINVSNTFDQETNKLRVVCKAMLMAIQVIKDMRKVKVVFASNNKNKLIEVREILEPLGVEVLSLKDIELNIDPEENGTTYAENAELKAKAIYEAMIKNNITPYPVIADDSGIEVLVLNRFPGIMTARVERMFEKPITEIILEKMLGGTERQAEIKTSIAYYDGKKSFAETHTTYGEISHQILGENGFGYDPIFLIGEKSLAQMTSEEKHAVNPRGSAIRSCAPLIINNIVLFYQLKSALMKKHQQG